MQKAKGDGLISGFIVGFRIMLMLFVISLVVGFLVWLVGYIFSEPLKIAYSLISVFSILIFGEVIGFIYGLVWGSKEEFAYLWEQS